MSELLITEVSDIGPQGLQIHLNQKVTLNGGLKADSWWVSWDKLGIALFSQYCDAPNVEDRREIRLKSVA